MEADILQNSSTEVGITLQKLLQLCSPELQSHLSTIFWMTKLLLDSIILKISSSRNDPLILTGIHVEGGRKSDHLACLYLGACILSVKGVNIKICFSHCLLHHNETCADVNCVSLVSVACHSFNVMLGHPVQIGFWLSLLEEGEEKIFLGAMGTAKAETDLTVVCSCLILYSAFSISFREMRGNRTSVLFFPLSIWSTCVKIKLFLTS